MHRLLFSSIVNASLSLNAFTYRSPCRSTTPPPFPRDCSFRPKRYGSYRRDSTSRHAPSSLKLGWTTWSEHKRSQLAWPICQVPSFFFPSQFVILLMTSLLVRVQTSCIDLWEADFKYVNFIKSRLYSTLAPTGRNRGAVLWQGGAEF